MELIFNPCDEFRRSPEDPVPQINSPHPLCWGLWDLYRSFNVCTDPKERVGCRKQQESNAPIHP